MSSSLKTRYSLAAGVLALVAFVLAALFSRSVFEHLPHLEDEVAYLYQAKVFASGHIVAPLPENRRAFWLPFVIDDTVMKTRFGKYTPGWPLVLALGVLLGQPWIINAFLAAISVALTYRVGCAIFNRDVGLIAALVMTFSPMLILLNATLMAHTLAICMTTAFIYVYWRLERARRPLIWGVLAGVLLGVIVIARPLSAVAVALPFIAWSGIRVLIAFVESVRSRSAAPLLRPLVPLLVLAVIAGGFSRITSVFNAAAVGDPNANLYQRVWTYDVIGFGSCCGRSGHNLEKGFRQTKWDLTLTAADTFGWQTGGFGPDVVKYLLVDGTNFPNQGYSLFLLPLGLLIGVGLWPSADDPKRQRNGLIRLAFATGWLVVFAALWLLPQQLPSAVLRIPEVGWIWLAAMLTWCLLPIVGFISLRNPTARYTWLLWSMMLCVVVLQFTYWIGSARYSTRYYAEAITAASLLTAVVFAWLMRAIGDAIRAQSVDKVKPELVTSGFAMGQRVVYGLLIAVTAYSFWMYSAPRVQLLYRYNQIEQSFLDEIAARRDGRPVLVIIRGPESGDDRVRWRALGELMAVTSPLLDSDIVGAWDYQAEGLHDKLIAQFPGRQVIEMEGKGNEAWFVGEEPPTP